MTPPKPPAEDDPLGGVREIVARYLFVSGAALSLAWTVAFAVWRPPITESEWLTLVCAYLVVTAACLLAHRQPPRRARGAMIVVALIIFGAIALSSVVLRWGLGNPALGLFGLVTCIVAAVSGFRDGTLLAALGGVTLAALALGVPTPADAVGVALHGALQAILLLTGLAGGGMLRKVIAHYVGALVRREQRFAGLLRIAADAYWETDSQHRVGRVARQGPDGRFTDLALPLGQVPWAMPGVRFDENALAALRRGLDARERLNEVPVTWQPEDGTVRAMYISGEPRFSAAGKFIGYWGVVWDVTPEMRTREALSASEIRYRELFNHLPTALVLHHDDRVTAANPAAAALLGYPGPDALAGQSLTGLHDAEDRDRVRRRVDLLRRLPPGTALEPEDIRLHTPDGRALRARTNGVHLPSGEGGELLSIYVDETARLDALDRLRRSEALLSHLVATSPDTIFVCELGTGRLAMVNAAFTRVTGVTPEQALAGTLQGIGIWRRDRDRETLIATLRRQGTVSDQVAELLHRDGSRRLLRMSAAVFELDGEAFAVISARDITASERARLEREAILDNAGIGIAVVRDEHFVQVNRFLEQMLDWPPGGLRDQPAARVWADDGEARALHELTEPRLAAGEAVDVECRARRRDGTVFVARLQAKAIDPTRPTQGGTIWLLEDVTERRRDAQALARARDEAEAASRAKSRFLANTSHELRTPLNALLGLARLVRSPDVDEPRRQQYIEQISDSAETLSAILSDILDLSKIEAGRLTLDQMPFDLQDLLDRLTQAYGTLADARGLQLLTTLDEDMPEMVLGDPVRVRQVLSNYLSNALKFTTQGRTTRWMRRLHGARVRFEVIDTGPGIDAAMRERLFQPFSQGDDSITRRIGGTGLGLSICRELARLMGGEVGMEPAPGGGSLFWAVLPLPPAQADARDTTGGTLQAELLAGARVLLVEDNAVNMMIAAALLQQWGVEVSQAAHGAQAVEMVEQAAAEDRLFDVVLMDMQMPVMGGEAATQVLRRRFSGEVLPIVALTAAALVSERQQAMRAGMNDFLTKPIDASRLRATLARLVGARRRD
jgi:PAS domain S-box-containing protein